MEPNASPVPNDEWSEALARVAAGDHAAINVLYDRFARPLYSFALKMLSNNTREAEEAVQDVFVSVWKKAGTFESGRAQVFTWLTVMTRNKCLDRLRAKSRRIPTADLLSEEAQERDVPEEDKRTAVDDLFDKERTGIIKEAVAKLPDEQKEVIELAFFSGMTHSEIAEHLDISIGTIKSRIRYGIQKLRSLLGGEADV